MVGENICQETKSKKIDDERIYFLEEIDKNELMGRNHKIVCAALNYLKRFFILASTINGCISISTFAFLLGIPIGVTISALGLKIFAIAAGIKKYKSVIKKKEKKH